MTKARTPYRATFAVLAVAVGAYALLQSLVIPVLPTIQAGLHTSQNTVTWVLTAYLLSASIFTPIMGRLGDMFGKERLLVLALVALSAGSIISAASTGIVPMLVGRVNECQHPHHRGLARGGGREQHRHLFGPSRRPA